MMVMKGTWQDRSYEKDLFNFRFTNYNILNIFIDYNNKLSYDSHGLLVRSTTKV